jgi:hypothetical protein
VKMRIVELNRICGFTVGFAVVMIVVVVEGERMWWLKVEERGCCDGFDGG